MYACTQPVWNPIQSGDGFRFFFISLIAYYFYLWIDSVKVGRMLGNLMS